MASITWTTFKSFVNTRGLSMQYLDLDDGFYHLAAVDGPFRLDYDIPKLSPTPEASEQLDFETNYKPYANRPVSQAVYMQTAPQLYVVAPLAISFLAPANTTTTNDTLLTAAHRFKGGEMYINNLTLGDYGQIQIIDKNNVLGLGANYVLSDWIPKWFVFPGVTNTLDIAELSATVPPGVFLRIKYTNTALLTAATVYLNIRTYKKP